LTRFLLLRQIVPRQSSAPTQLWPSHTLTQLYSFLITSLLKTTSRHQIWSQPPPNLQQKEYKKRKSVRWMKLSSDGCSTSVRRRKLRALRWPMQYIGQKQGAVSSPLTDSVHWSEEKYSMTDALHQSEASLLLWPMKYIPERWSEESLSLWPMQYIGQRRAKERALYILTILVVKC
jgi:hypothetical protein